MRLRLTASLLTVLCSWVLWEKWTDYGETGAARIPVIHAVYEAGILSDCRKAMPNFIKEKAMRFKQVYKDPEHQIIEGPYAVIVGGGGKREIPIQMYEYECLPSTVDPYHH